MLPTKSPTQLPTSIPVFPPTAAPSNPVYFKYLIAGFQTIAGGNGRSSSGDGGPASSASINTPTSLWLDSLNQIYIVDYSACVIRKVSADSIITTPKVFDVEAQDISKKTKITPMIEPCSVLQRETFETTPVDKKVDVSPAISELSSSFLSSASSIMMESDEDEREVRSNKRPKRKKRKDFFPSPSTKNIRDLEEGLNEKLIELSLSKELDQPFVNEAIDDLESESDDSLNSMFGQERY
eukprot:gene7890-8531_t